MCSSWSQLTPLPWQYWDKRKIATTLQLPRLFVSFHVLRSSCWDAWYRYLKAVEVVLGGGGEVGWPRALEQFTALLRNQPVHPLIITET